MKFRDIIIILATSAFLVGCNTTKEIQIQSQFEQIQVPENLFVCAKLVKKELPAFPLKNADVHTIVEKILGKNATCAANMGAIHKIIDDYNAKVAELNARQKKGK